MGAWPQQLKHWGSSVPMASTDNHQSRQKGQGPCANYEPCTGQPDYSKVTTNHHSHFPELDTCETLRASWTPTLGTGGGAFFLPPFAKSLHTHRVAIVSLGTTWNKLTGPVPMASADDNSFPKITSTNVCPHCLQTTTTSHDVARTQSQGHHQQLPPQFLSSRCQLQVGIWADVSTLPWANISMHTSMHRQCHGYLLLSRTWTSNESLAVLHSTLLYHKEVKFDRSSASHQIRQ